MKLELFMTMKTWIFSNQKAMIICAVLAGAFIIYSIIFSVVGSMKRKRSLKLAAELAESIEREESKKHQLQLESARANREKAEQEAMRANAAQNAVIAKLVAYDKRTVQEWRTELKIVVTELLP